MDGRQDVMSLFMLCFISFSCSFRRCSLTASCCAALSSVLSKSTSLIDLSLSGNKLEDSGVEMLCKGLKDPGCRLQTLSLFKTGLTDDSTGVLCWALSTKQSLQRLSLRENAFSGRSVASFYTLKETIPSIDSEILPSRPPLSHEEYLEDRNAYRYRATFPGKGTFACVYTRLCFEVESAGCITYDLLPWGHQRAGDGVKDFKIAGSLFDIKADPGFVKAVYLPHFVSLKDGDVDVSQIQVAHFQPDGAVTLEKPSEVQPFHAVLKNPTFSKVGIVWTIRTAIQKWFPARACAMLYRNPKAAPITLHLYLISDEPLLWKELDKTTSDIVKIKKPPQTKPLYYGYCYSVETDAGSEIIPMELEFDFLSPDHHKLPYTEIYMEDIPAKGVTIGLKCEWETTSVWQGKVRPGDISLDRNPGLMEPKTFIKRHRLALIRRITLVEPLTYILQQRKILSEFEVEAIFKESTRHTKISTLLGMVEKKGADAEQEFAAAVMQANPCLFKDLE
ncbi:caspase recruitment domain-containing protein 8 [Ambystoma mexicanum]|uniref:caspase recruitment domain-containing protein 8 n=1 Tax=Ambystoma mexicanum TaxID=8296 RepID=UPI0037E71B65